MEDEEKKRESERKYFSGGYMNARGLDQQCLIWTNQDARIHTEIKWCFFVYNVRQTTRIHRINFSHICV